MKFPIFLFIFKNVLIKTGLITSAFCFPVSQLHFLLSAQLSHQQKRRDKSCINASVNIDNRLSFAVCRVQVQSFI